MLIVPTQDIVFAVKKDGSLISNFTEKRGGGDKINPSYFLLLFKGLKKFVETCSERELAAYALTDIIMSSDIHKALIERMEAQKASKE